MGYHDASDAAAVAAAYASSLVDWYLLGSCGYIVKGINTGFPRTAGVFALGAVWLWSNEVQALQMHGGLPGGAPCRAVHGAAREMWKHRPAGWCRAAAAAGADSRGGCDRVGARLLSSTALALARRVARAGLRVARAARAVGRRGGGGGSKKAANANITEFGINKE